MKTILILAANPKNTSKLRLDEEVRDIDEALRRSDLRHQFTIEQRWAVQTRTLQRALLDVRPQIVHFCGHGEGSLGLALEDNAGNLKLVSTQALSGLFKILSTKVKIECVLLNACYAEHQAKAIAHHVDYVIGMNQAVEDTAAIAFSVGFYDALGAGESVEMAYELGCNSIQLEAGESNVPRKAQVAYGSNSVQTTNVEQHLVPVLLKKSDLVPVIEPTATKQSTALEKLLVAEKTGEARVAQLDKSIETVAQKLRTDQSLKEALAWLEKRQSLAKQASDHTFQSVSNTQRWSSETKKRFHWEIGKYIEFVYYSMLTDTNDLLDEPPITPKCDNPRAYMAAFSYIKGRILPRIDVTVKDKIKYNFDYLYERIIR